ncbi:MAG TPA: phosphatase PAP2 family protein [Candidatus Dormibacteraeota bacterium]|nr:phosphatase PAP2 family protein [Candidatus Dormibacteraeota bacterium]
MRGFLRANSFRVGILSIASIFFVTASYGQEVPATLPDAPVATDVPTPGSSQDIEVTWKQLPKRFLQDQKEIWLFPAQLAKGHHWIPTLAVVGGTAGLIAADPHAMPYFRDHRGNLDDLNDVFDGPITSAAIGIVPVSFLLVGYWRHDDYAKGTALLAGEAYANSAVIDLVIKAITRRKRPADVAATNSFNDTFFSGGKSPFKGSAFPSGHAAGAFAVAAVISHRYRQHRWVPWVAYGFATAISLSRVTTLAHFPSDVFLGAVLGYTATHFVVLRH